MTAQERLDEYMWLVAGGIWAENAANRAGYANLKSLERVATKHRRTDVLATIYTARRFAA